MQARCIAGSRASSLPRACIAGQRKSVSSRKGGSKRADRVCRWRCSAIAPGPTVAHQSMVPARSAGAPSGQPGCASHGDPKTGLEMPLGAHYNRDMGAHNFALYSSSASAVHLVLFTRSDLSKGQTTAEIKLDSEINRTGNIWHIAVPNIPAGYLYGFRVDGGHQNSNQPNDAGLRHDVKKVLVDPYATSVISRDKWGQPGNQKIDYTDDNVLGLADTWPQAAAPVPDPHAREFDWQLPMQDLIIYEAHVRGFTQDKSSHVTNPGTYSGMTERLDYLQELGITAIELLPIFEFNELEYYTPILGTDLYRYNFWGYSTVAFFAPMARFASDVNAANTELKMLVREAHKRGMEIILDIVFNHTAEGNEMGPHISFRGVDNRSYYMLAPEGQYYNYSGCGNTFNCNDPVARQLIVDCLRYWVQEYHIDGFRFDLASILTRAPSAWHPAEWIEPPSGHNGAPVAKQINCRGAITAEDGYMTDGAGTATGTPLGDPPVLQMISEDPLLRSTKLIAEAWDCDGLNQVGAFPHYGGRWAEWNGHFRDNVRQFLKGSDGDFIGLFASAIMGSSEIYGRSETHEGDWWGQNSGSRWRGGRTPLHTVNFVTAHDGFTLRDLVSYNDKHNEMNGEDNNDGESHNLSWNCGTEGETDNTRIKNLRDRQIRNHAAALILAQGVPMMLMGDEYGHTKDGNNNTYCHDSKWNYIDWNKAWDDESGLRRFWSYLIRLRRMRPEFGQPQYLSHEVSWQGEKRHSEPDWTGGRFLAMTLRTADDGNAMFVAWNTKHEGVVVDLPEQGHGREWRIVLDTGKPAPYDFMAVDDWLTAENARAAMAQAAAWTLQDAYAMLPWSCVVLESVTEGSSFVCSPIDRWDEMRAWSEPVQGAPGVPPPGSPVAEPVGDVALEFGRQLASPSGAPRGTGSSMTGLPGSLTNQPAVPGAAPRAAPAPAPAPPAAAPQAQPAERETEDAGAAGGEAAEAAPMASGDEFAEEEELQRLAQELLGSTSDIATMSPLEKREMLKILRENLSLRRKLE